MFRRLFYFLGDRCRELQGWYVVAVNVYSPPPTLRSAILSGCSTFAGYSNSSSLLACVGGLCRRGLESGGRGWKWAFALSELFCGNFSQGSFSLLVTSPNNALCSDEVGSCVVFHARAFCAAESYLSFLSGSCLNARAHFARLATRTAPLRLHSPHRRFAPSFATLRHCCCTTNV